MHKYVEYLEKIAGDREKEKEIVEIISEALERIKQILLLPSMILKKRLTSIM